MAIALNIKLPSTDAISNINFLFLRNKHIVPFLCGITFLFGCLLHYQRGYFGQSVNYFHATGSDDAYISFRYGWNLIHYDTFSWNESGFRQTEGFTNPIWVLLSAAWALADNKDVIYPAMSITSAILTGIVLVSLAENVRENNTKNFSLAGILLLSLSPILWSHTTSGLESGLFGALIGLTAYISIFPQPKDRKALGFLVLASTLLRSDGFIYMFILLGALGVAKLSTWKRVGLGSLSGLAALLLWRTITFGSVVPNTAVAKLSFPWTQRIAPGMQFLLIALPGFLPLLLLGLFALRYIPRKQQFALGLVLAGWIAYYVYIGGDIYHERHLIGIMFLLACMASYQFDSMKVDGKQAIAYLVLFTAFMFLPMMIGDSRFEYWKQKPEDPWILFGKEIGKDRQRYGVIVTGAAGKIPFFAGGDFVDEMGLNDPYLATLKSIDFVPGHSAGSRKVAIEIAQTQSRIFSYFAFGKELNADNEDCVLIWIDNSNPKNGVQYSLKNSDFLTILASHPLRYSMLFQGIDK